MIEDRRQLRLDHEAHERELVERREHEKQRRINGPVYKKGFIDRDGVFPYIEEHYDDLMDQIYI
jgi:hypothetical protein